MVARAINSVTLTCGLVAVPCKIYTTAKSGKLSFNMMSPDHNKVAQRLVDSVTSKEVKREETLKGYEYQKGKFVIFSQKEFDSLLDPKSSKTIEVNEFVEKDKIPEIVIDKTYYVGPDKGAESAYSLLTDAMLRNKVAAVATWHNRGRDDLVVISPYNDGKNYGLILHKVSYPEEVNSFADIGMPSLEVGDKEKGLADLLVSKYLNPNFDFAKAKYYDHATERLQKAVNKKINGDDISDLPEPVKQNMVDLMEQLKASLSAAKQ